MNTQSNKFLKSDNGNTSINNTSDSNKTLSNSNPDIIALSDEVLENVSAGKFVIVDNKPKR